MVAILLLSAAGANAAQLVEAELKSEFVPNPVPIAALLPDGHDKNPEWPVLLLLHGGNGDRGHLALMRPTIEEMWKNGTLPKMVVVTPSVAARSFYMDYKDGSERWESFIMKTLLQHLEVAYGATKNPRRRFIGGVSMGGMGSLRIAFKHPDAFGAVASMEPGIEPVLKWNEIQPRHRFWRGDALFEAAFGKPVDPAYWEANNPASIAKANAAKLRASGLKIYLECGDNDMFLLHEGTEFLHRVLWDGGVKHEYHSVNGADHVGRTIRPRFAESMAFLNRVMNPPAADPAVDAARKKLAPLKRRAGVVE